MKQKLNILILLTGVLVFLPFVGCGTVINKFMPKGEYEAPQLSKSELATIQIDTERGWLQRYNLIVIRINGKLALRKNIKGNEKVAIDEILVAPGKQNISVMTIHTVFHGDKPETIQTLSRFSADMKVGSIYLLQDDNKLIDADTDRVVSKSKLLSLSEFGWE